MRFPLSRTPMKPYLTPDMRRDLIAIEGDRAAQKFIAGILVKKEEEREAAFQRLKEKYGA